MSKNSHFTGQPVYSQVLKLLDKEKILQISRETKGSEAYVKRFDGYKHLVVMLFGILKHFDSLRELEIGMKAEAHKLVHLGMDYLVRRSTLAEANIRRPQEFFARVYAYLLEKYAKFLADSRPPKSYKGQTHEPKDWEKLLYMMDSTTITLFDNILKGVGRHPKSGKKKGGMKVHTVMKYLVGVPMVVQLTSAAKHDHYLLKEVHLPKDSTLAMDRGYIDIAQFQRLTEEGVCYVTKMKKNLNYKVLKSTTYVNPDGLVTHIDQKVLFTRGELTHEARRVEIFNEKKKPAVLLTNNFEFSVEDISEIYRLRWAIESLYKQLKQNFPLHFFYGDSVNAIQIQTWVVLIANLLITVLSRSIKRSCAFSQVVTMVRLTLMYYIDFVAFMENPDKTWNNILTKQEQKAPPEPSLFDYGGLLLEKRSPKPYFTGLRTELLCSFKFYRTAIILYNVLLVIISIDEIDKVHFRFFVNLPVSCKGPAAVDVSCHGTHKFGVFHFLVEIADEIAPCHMACGDIANRLLNLLPCNGIKNSHHSVDAAFPKHSTDALVVLVHLLCRQELFLFSFVAFQYFLCL